MPADKSSSNDHERPSRRLLVLMRHAKSDWSDETLTDHERPLNERGRRDAPRMARWLVKVDAPPDRVLSSSSRRTRETVSLMLPEWAGEPTVCFNDSLYLATPEEILRTIRDEGCDSRVLMVVAHNPGMAQAASELSGQWIDMATAAIAVFDVSLSDWAELQAGPNCRLVHFMRPKAL